MTHTRPTCLLTSLILTMCGGITLSACGPDGPTTDPVDQGMDMPVDMDMTVQDAGCTGQACLPDLVEACGDGTVQQGEQCDDGNLIAGDGCDAQCRDEEEAVCGDGTPQVGEACDAGQDVNLSCAYGESSCEVCNDMCQLVPGTVSTCGDGVVQSEQGELCDEGAQNDDLGACLTDCTRPIPMKVYGGVKNSYLLMSNGTVYTWGDNEYGQLGDGTTQTRTRPERLEGLSGVVDIVGGDRSMCALLGSGDVWCIGRGDDGELGYGLFESSDTLVQVNLSDVTQISGFGPRYCALTQSGEVWCWGNDRFGGLGTPGDETDQSSPSQVILPSSATTVTSGIHSCAILDNSEVWCWGGERIYYGEESTPVVDRPPEHVTDLDGASEIIALTSSTIIKSQADNEYYGVGDNRSEELNLITAEPVVYDLINIDKVTSSSQIFTSGNGHACSISSNMTLACWGLRNFQQISKKTFGVFYTEVSEVQNAKHVGLGARHTCAIDGDNEIWCWGSNEDGQLGLPVSEELFGPQKIEIWPSQ